MSFIHKIWFFWRFTDWSNENWFCLLHSQASSTFCLLRWMKALVTFISPSQGDHYKLQLQSNKRTKHLYKAFTFLDCLSSCYYISCFTGHLPQCNLNTSQTPCFCSSSLLLHRFSFLQSLFSPTSRWPWDALPGKGIVLMVEFCILLRWCTWNCPEVLLVTAANLGSLLKTAACPSSTSVPAEDSCQRVGRAGLSKPGPEWAHLGMIWSILPCSISKLHRKSPRDVHFFLIQLAVLFQTLFSHFKDNVCTPWCTLLLNEAWRSVPWIVIANECNILVNSR